MMSVSGRGVLCRLGGEVPLKRNEFKTSCGEGEEGGGVWNQNKNKGGARANKTLQQFQCNIAEIALARAQFSHRPRKFPNAETSSRATPAGGGQGGD
jgi:hypothetical protein